MLCLSSLQIMKKLENCTFIEQYKSVSYSTVVTSKVSLVNQIKFWLSSKCQLYNMWNIYRFSLKYFPTWWVLLKKIILAVKWSGRPGWPTKPIVWFWTVIYLTFIGCHIICVVQLAAVCSSVSKAINAKVKVQLVAPLYRGLNSLLQYNS
jgi:hypothetical protein